MKCKEAPATAHVGVRVQHFRPSLEHETSGAWDFTSPGAIVDWDIMLVVGETKFYVHKTTLCAASPVLKAMIAGHFREAQQLEIPIENADADEFHAFLKAIYPCGPRLNAQNLEALHRLADYFDVPFLTNACVGMFHEIYETGNLAVVEKLLLANKLEVTALEDSIVSALSAHDIDQLTEHARKGEFTVDCMLKILKRSSQLSLGQS